MLFHSYHDIPTPLAPPDLRLNMMSSLLGMASPKTEQVSSVPSSNAKDDSEWFDDVPGNLDTFVRLSKAGLYAKANLFYDHLLKQHAANDFAVAAQYADTLIEQGAFKAAEDFLKPGFVSNRMFEKEEQTVFGLLYANARMYTHFEWDQAAEVAAKAVGRVGQVRVEENVSYFEWDQAAEVAAKAVGRVGEVRVEANVSPTQLQIQIISLRIIGIILRHAQTDEGLEIAMKASVDSGSDKPAGWRDFIVSLLRANHVWEAHTLFKISIEYEGPHDEAELRQILDAVPCDLDTMYRLVEMSMLSECLRCVDLSSDKTGYWSQVLDIALKDCSSTMDGTQYRIETSSAYQALQLFAAEQQKVQDVKLPDQMLKSAMKNGNFMFALAISARYALNLPEDWMAQTGADIKAVTYWHRVTKYPQPHFPTGRVLLDVESYSTASESSHYATRALRITVSHSTARSFQIWLRAAKRTMQRLVFAVVAFTLNEVSHAANVCIGLFGPFGEVIKSVFNTAIGTLHSYGNLSTLLNSFGRITQKAILVSVTAILKISVGAMIGYLGPADSIWKTIIRDPANQELFQVLERDWWVVARFLVDLLEPMKRFASAGSLDGDPSHEAKTRNSRNELDLSQRMNRHAVLCQIQRFFVSILDLLRQKDASMYQFVMDTRLETDTTELCVTRTALKRKDDNVRSAESWLFVNGIGGEFYWNHLAVSKIQDFLFDVDNPEDNNEDANARRTEIKSVFNRSDGILWDLIECVSESETNIERKPLSTSRRAPLSSRTASSRIAQATLSNAIRSALIDAKSSRKDIVMIAHSQGCLLLRVALQEIFSDVHEDFRDVMRTHLHVYTFGNPAHDWEVHAYTAGTEHFANELDFVAKLGVLRHFSSDPVECVGNDLTYCSRCRAGDEKHLSGPRQLIFVNNKRQSGHLFGSQYSLQPEDYDCVNGRSSSALLSRSMHRSYV